MSVRKIAKMSRKEKFPLSHGEYSFHIDVPLKLYASAKFKKKSINYIIINISYLILIWKNISFTYKFC